MASVPHEVVGDELTTAFERIVQGKGSVWPGQLDFAIYLDHGQPPAGCRDGITFSSVRLLSNA